MPTDISERGIESLIMRHMTGMDGLVFSSEGMVAETPDALAAAQAAGSGWLAGNPRDYDRTYALDVPQLFQSKTFARTYDFLASVIHYTHREWEKLSIVLNLLIPKLPAPKDEDLSKGILEAVDMDSYRVEKEAAMRIALPDDNAEIAPIPVEGGGRKPEPELDRLSNILKAFNDHFGTLFTDADRVMLVLL